MWQGIGEGVPGWWKAHSMWRQVRNKKPEVVSGQRMEVWTLTGARPRMCWAKCCAKLLPSCLTLCKPMDCSPPGSSVLGILSGARPRTAKAMVRLAAFLPSALGCGRHCAEDSLSLSLHVASEFWTCSSRQLLPVAYKLHPICFAWAKM